MKEKMENASEMVYEALQKAAGATTIKVLTLETGLYKGTVARVLGKLVEAGEVEVLNEKKGKSTLYRLPGVQGQSDRVGRNPVRKEELEQAKKKAVPGRIIRFRDDDGQIRRTKVSEKYQHHCRMEDGHSFTWGQLAIYFRNGRKGYVT